VLSGEISLRVYDNKMDVMESLFIKIRFYLIGFILIFLITSCQRSHFATTSRYYKRGKATYCNNHHLEIRRTVNGKSDKNQLKKEDRQTPADECKTDLSPDITQITPVYKLNDELLFASISTEPMFIQFNKNTPGPSNYPLYSIINSRLTTTTACPDTLIKKIETESGIQEKPLPDTRKIEKFGVIGFILSVLGLFPIIGLPFAILGLVFGIRSLRKIHRDPTHYKGKGFAITGIILGITGIIGSIVLIGMYISIYIWGVSGGTI
jgi:hypothetical protein